MHARLPDRSGGKEAQMTAPELDTLEAYKRELADLAKRGGALAMGVADPAAFTAAQEGQRPSDLLPDVKAVLVVGGGQPRAGDWRSPNYRHMETTSTADRVTALGNRLAQHIERRFGYYAVTVPPGVDRGRKPFLSIALAAELAGCGTASLAGPVLHPEHGFMYYAATLTTLPLPVDGPLATPACPAPECATMWNDKGTTPCLATCPIDDGGCLGGRIENGRVAERRYDVARCTTRVHTHFIPGFQRALESVFDEPDKDKRRMILWSTAFTRTLWSMSYSNVSQGQCFECMRVCPVGAKHRELR
jgi:epoxyqueuosine reductase QueG